MRFQWNALILVVVLAFGCKEDKKYHDEKDKISTVTTSDKIAAVLEFQESLNAEFKNPEQSPLPDRFRSDFESLDFFAPDTNYVVTANLVRTPEALPFLMPTNTGRTSEEVVYGIVTFSLNGKEFSLEVYQNRELVEDKDYEDYLFLPFSDQTNGNETYGGGRYLDLRIPAGKIPLCWILTKLIIPIVHTIQNIHALLFQQLIHLRQEYLLVLKDFKK